MNRDYLEVVPLWDYDISRVDVLRCAPVTIGTEDGC